MSTIKQATPLPTPQDAAQTLFSQVRAQVLFAKLAQAGFAPQNDKEAADLLALAGKLRMVNADPRVKAAAVDGTMYGPAIAALDAVLAANGLDGGIKAANAQEHDVALQAVATRLAQDPAIYGAVMSLKAAEAQQLAEAMDGTAPAA